MLTIDWGKLLNPEQLRAVQNPSQYQLVLAGAGSGKTRVLVYRIVWLMTERALNASSILAVTFTNKAAGEMRHRLSELLGPESSNLWVGTFHSLAHRILRMYAQEAGLPQTFQILDSDDQLRALKRIMHEELHLDDKEFPPKKMQQWINHHKERGETPESLPANKMRDARVSIDVFKAYNQWCDRNGVVDFAELLLRCLKLWRDCPAVLEKMRTRFSHILVDEFQDTNTIQYAWLTTLVASHTGLTLVGDDDQSIYGWRGARVEHLHHIQEDFPDMALIRLEQNYRSTATILAAANALIAHNTERLGKNLWTEAAAGSSIGLYVAGTEWEEARWIVDRILEARLQHARFKDCAILYRSNAQSRVLEESLMHAGIPYRIYGGLRFFDRSEIKDVLAYMRLVHNAADDLAFERAIAVPSRGIGDKTLEVLKGLSREHGVPLSEVARLAVAERALTPRIAPAMERFIDLIDELKRASSMALADFIDYLVRCVGLVDYYATQDPDRGRARAENIKELVTAAREFEQHAEIEPAHLLQEFLVHAVLVSGERIEDGSEDAVQLMTLHAAKGLEFPCVFIAGLEEGLFPHYLAIQENLSGHGIEEERRLCYVGMTRAKQRLYLTYSESRRLHGRVEYTRVSRFLSEIPRIHVEPMNVGQLRASKPSSSSLFSGVPKETHGIRLGQGVAHRKFGQGVVVAIEGEGQKARISVRFENYGTKQLLAELAQLQPI